MAGASRSLSRSCLSTARYISRRFQGRIEAPASSGRLHCAVTSPLECDAESHLPSSAGKSAHLPSPVARCDGSVSTLCFPFGSGKDLCVCS